MNILIVDDHPLIREGLANVLAELDPEGRAIEAASAGEALAASGDHASFSLVLLDLALPGTRGLELLGAMRRDFPRLPIAVLSATHDRATVDAAMAAGARGYIAKTASGRELVLAVERLLDGRTCPRPDLARAPAPPLPGNAVAPDALGLTRRQSDVLQLLAQGKPNKLICRDLRLSEGTVKVHVSAILRALNVHSRAQAIAELGRRGFAADRPAHT